MYRKTIGSLVLAFSFVAATARADEIQWRSDYPAAVQEAQQKGRPLLIEVSTDNCVFCRKLEEQTFRDPAVIAMVNAKYVPLRVHTANDPHGIVERLQIGSFPTLLIAHPQRNVLATQVGFIEPTPFHQLLQTHMDSVAPPAPEWMDRDLQTARQAVGASQFNRALWLLRGIIEDGKERPVQVKAKHLLVDVEQQAAARLVKIKDLAEKGQNVEALDAAGELMVVFAGTQAAADAGKMLSSIKVVVTQAPPVRTGSGEGSGSIIIPPEASVKPPPVPPEPVRADVMAEARVEQARDCLAQAREEFAKHRYQTCLTRCDMIVWCFPDLPEAREAQKLTAEIKATPELLTQACDTMTEQLAAMLITLADGWMRRGQPQQAVLCLERAVKACPGSRNADLAQIRLSQIQGQPTQPADYKAP